MFMFMIINAYLTPGISFSGILFFDELKFISSIIKCVNFEYAGSLRN